MLRKLLTNNSYRCLTNSRNLSSLNKLEVDKDKALKMFLIDKIKATGPITVAEYMKIAISAPAVGFYGGYSKTKQIFGTKGDFITAPELTQLFGEMIGLWIYHELAYTGYNGEWQLIECGPGSGTLMNDILSVFAKFGESKMSVHLVETSDALIKLQEETLCVDNSTCTFEFLENKTYIKKNKTKTGVPIYWYKNIDDIPESFSVFVANEFLDALPIHQFMRDEDNVWHEVYVNLDKNNNLVFMNSKGENIHTKGLLKSETRDNPLRKYWEISPDAGTFVNQVAERIIYKGGFGLIIDYGHNGTREDLSLRAYSQHKQVHPLSRPGAIDLTADVDFKHLSSLIVDRTLVYGPQTQREFLAQMGIQLRLRSLLKKCANSEQQKIIIDGYNYLMGEMGTKFLAMSIFPKTLQSILEKRGAPAGFNTGKNKEE